MSKPTVAIVGRPNVGKSTFFNYIVGKRISIVEDTPGVTRDRVYADANWRGRNFTLIDTGGIEPESDDVILSQMREQANLAISMADVIIFVTDIKQGITAADNDIALMLRKSKKPIVLVCNKADNYGKVPDELYEFYNLGLGEPHRVSSVNAIGIGDVLDAIYDELPPKSEDEEEDDVIKVAIIGKPNVGKSSLLNAILQEDRAIVTNIEGTTRDLIEEEIVIDGVPLKIIDTAGIRESKDKIEQIGIEKSKKIAKQADLIIAILDGEKKLSKEDEQILEIAKEKKSIIVINKIDLPNFKNNLLENINLKMPVIKISAKNGEGIEQLYYEISKLFQLQQIDANSEYLVTNIRHKNLINKAKEQCKKAEHIIYDKMPIDIITIEITNALESLGQITGENVTDDVIKDIFSKFCLGK